MEAIRMIDFNKNLCSNKHCAFLALTDNFQTHINAYLNSSFGGYYIERPIQLVNMSSIKRLNTL